MAMRMNQVWMERHFGRIKPSGSVIVVRPSKPTERAHRLSPTDARAARVVCLVRLATR